MFSYYHCLKHNTKAYQRKIFSMRVFWVITISLGGYKGLMQAKSQKNT